MARSAATKTNQPLALAPTPYAYVTSGGVSNTRVLLTEKDATLADLHTKFAKPLELDVSSTTYHKGTKRDRSNVKKELHYFVGGTVEPAKRDDANVQSRTLLTLDVEQGDADPTPPPPPETVVQALAAMDGAGWVYTSISHTPESPRYRVVLPLGKPITGTTAEMQASLQASTIAAARKLGIEAWTKPESWVLSQPMYLPAKLRGGTYYESCRSTGKSWGAVKGKAVAPAAQPADIPDERPDPILNALRSAGLYLGEKRGHAGMHFIRCPYHAQHEAENDTQTVYYEAHFDGNPRAAVKCFDTAPDVDGVPHLSYQTLVRHLRADGLLPKDGETTETQAVLEDYEAFNRANDMAALLRGPVVQQEWAIEQFAPIGRVTVLGGPGGQGKSLAMLHTLVHLACGLPFGELRTPNKSKLRSLYISYEDGPAQLQARVQTITSKLSEALSDHDGRIYSVSDHVEKNVRVHAADDDAHQWLMLTKPDRFGTPEATARVAWVTGYLKAFQYRLLALDPVVFTHQLSENDIADMAAYMRVLGQIAKAANCAIVVIHHMSKSGAFGVLDSINQNSLRGASSISDNARSVMAGVMMPLEDCKAYDVNPEERHHYFVMKHVKHNYSAPLPLQVFRNEGGFMTHRPEIRKLADEAIQAAKENDKAEAEAAKREEQAIAVLEYLDGLTASTFASINMVLDGVARLPGGRKLHARDMKTLPEWMEEAGWINIQKGQRNAKEMQILKGGKAHLKRHRQALL